MYTVAVGVGKKVDAEVLSSIAGEKGIVLAVERFEELASELRAVKEKVCGKTRQILNVVIIIVTFVLHLNFQFASDSVKQ